MLVTTNCKFFLFPFPLIYVVYIYSTMDMFLVLLGCKWYGMACHSSLIPFPLRAGMILSCALFRTWYLLVSLMRMILCYSLFCDHSQVFWEVG